MPSTDSTRAISGFPHIDNFEVLGQIGQGARNVVFKARSRGRLVAVKVPRFPDQRDLLDFCREASLQARVASELLPEILEVGQQDGLAYLVSEFIDGIPLSDILRKGRLSPEQTAQLAQQICQVLLLVHNSGLIHRDLKPSNIIVTSFQRYRLIDFGLATRLSEELVGARAAEKGEATGTFRYSAPEQTGMLDLPTDGRADLYALGVVLYECLTGQPPFDDEDPVKLLRMHATEMPRALGDIVPQAPTALVNCIERMLAKDPQDRPSSAGQVLEDLMLLGPPVIASAKTSSITTSSRTTSRKLVGRKRELAHLHSAWGDTLSDQGKLLVLIGAAGSGKSLIVDHFVQQIEDDGLLFVCRCEPTQAPFGVLHDLLQQAQDQFDGLPRDSQEPLRQRLTLRAGESARSLGTFSRVFAKILDLGNPSSDKSEIPLQPDNFLHSLADLIVQFCQTSPILLYLDDLHWIDSSSARLLGLLVPKLSQTRILIVATARDDGEPPSEFDWRPFIQMRVGGLDRQEQTQLVQQELGMDCEPAVLDTVMLIGQGNPLAIGETLWSALNAGLFVPHWGRWRRTEYSSNQIELPSSVIELIRRRLPQLKEGQQELLECAALMGQRFRLDQLLLVAFPAELSQPDKANSAQATLQSMLLEASRLHLIEQHSDEAYRFSHESVREALLQKVPQERLLKLHAHIAASLDPTDPSNLFARADHAWAARETGHFDQFAVQYQAGLAAQQQHAYSESYQFFQRAHQYCPDEAECPKENCPSAGSAVSAAQPNAAVRSEFFEQYAETAYRVGHLDRSYQLIEKGQRSAETPQQRARLHCKMAEYHLLEVDSLAALDSVTQGLAQLGQSPAPSAGKSMFFALTNLRWWFGHRRAPSSKPLEDQILCRLYLASCRAHVLEGDVVRYLHDLTRAAQVAGSLEKSPYLALAYVFGGGLLAGAGLTPLAQNLFQRALELARTNPMLSATSQAYIAILTRFSGQEVASAAMMSEILVKQAHWLPTYEFVSCAIDITHNFHCRGLVKDAHAWAELGAKRVQDSSFPAVLTCTFHAVYSAVGRNLEAQKFAQLCKTNFEASPSRLRRSAYLVSSLHASYELDQYGPEVEEWISQFHALGFHPLTCPYHARLAYILEAHWRLRLCQRGKQQHAVLRDSLVNLRRLAHLSLFQTHLAVVEAGYQRLSGHFAKARQLFDQAEHLSQLHDNAWVRLEVSRQRAYLLASQGLNSASIREAKLALSLALGVGWISMSRVVREEFQLVGATAGPHSADGSWQSALQIRLQRNLEALLQVTAASSNLLDSTEVARSAVEEMVRLFGAERGLLFLCDKGKSQFEYGCHSDGRVIVAPEDFATSVLEQVHSSGSTLLLNGGDDGCNFVSESAKKFQLRSVIAAPLMLQKRLVGVLYLDTRLTRGAFIQEDLQLLSALTAQIAISLETARNGRLEVQVQSEREQRQWSEKLSDVVGSLMGHRDRLAVFERLLDGLARLVDYDSGYFISASHAEIEQMVGPDQGDSACKVILPLVHSRPTPQRPLEALVLECTRPLGSVELKLVQSLVGYACLALENAELFEDVQRLASVDELSGLFNRRHFFQRAAEEFARADRLGHSLCVLMFDIDHFKKVNDTYGHAAGDAVIRATSQLSSATLRGIDLIGRYGGEEFAVVLVGAELESARQTAERLRIRIAEQQVHSAELTLSVTSSLGVAQRHPKETVDQALERADSALYRAKQNGRNRVEVDS